MHESGDRLARDAATRRVLQVRAEVLAGRPSESVVLDAIGTRVIAKDLRAPVDRPARDTATMDGYAFRAGDGYPLAVADDETYPEDDSPSIDEGEAVRIATGAPLPDRADVVLRREDATVEGGQLRGPDLAPGTNVHERASTVASGETLFSAGERLSPKDAILLADLGFDAVEVHERFSAGVLATGTEIHEGHSPDRDSAMLAGLVESWGHRATLEGTVPDEYDRIVAAVRSAGTAHDVVVTTGGTSVGTKDHVARAFDDAGDVLLQGVGLRPGAHVAVARIPESDAVAVAFPGKPLAAHTAATLVARPLFTGETALPAVEATMALDLGVPDDGQEYAVPVTLSDDGATPLGHEDSSLPVYGETFAPSALSSNPRAARADGLVVTTADLSAGETVRVIPYESLE